MNKLKNILVLTVLLAGTSYTYAQKVFYDSIHVQVGSKTDFELAVNDYKDLGTNVEKDMKSLQSVIRKTEAIPEGIPYTIRYTPEKLVSIKESGQEERIIWTESGEPSYQFNNRCIIKSDNYYLLIRFNEIEVLLSDNLITDIREAIDSTESIQGRFALTYNYAYEKEKLVHNFHLDKPNGELDQLNIETGVGTNLIKNQPVIDLSAEFGLTFCKKGLPKNNFYLSYNQLCLFDDDDNIKLNGFANVGYRYNLSEQKKPYWLTLEMGYLVARNGDFFDKNTFKVATNWKVGKFISVSPQLYISSETTYPALRIGFGF